MARMVINHFSEIILRYQAQKWDFRTGASGTGSRAGIENDGRGCKILQRTRKPELEEAQGYQYQSYSLHQECDIICSCLSKNVKLLY